MGRRPRPGGRPVAARRLERLGRRGGPRRQREGLLDAAGQLEHELLQNAWLVLRERGQIRWRVFRIMGPALAVGVGIGFVMVRLIPDAVMPILVAVSALGSLVTLIAWRATPGPVEGAIAGTALYTGQFTLEDALAYSDNENELQQMVRGAFHGSAASHREA